MNGPTLLSAQASIIHLHHNPKIIQYNMRRLEIWYSRKVKFILQSNLYLAENQEQFEVCLLCFVLLTTCLSLVYSPLADWACVVELTPGCQTQMQAPMGPVLIITERMLRSSQIEMSSHMPFVWMALHFYHSHMEPVWPSRSRTGCTPPVNSQPPAYLPQRPWLYVSHMGRSTTRVLPHSTSSLQLTFCYVSAHLLFIRRPHALYFSQALAVSGLRSKFRKWLVA